MQGADRVDQLERGADGALGVVLVGDGRAPDRHDRVADELLDRAAVQLDDLGRGVEVAAQELADGLGVAVLGERREADEVGEQDVTRRRSAVAGVAAGRHRPALRRRPPRTWPQRRAESRVGPVRLAA